jgi:hypothetical protein
MNSLVFCLFAMSCLSVFGGSPKTVKAPKLELLSSFYSVVPTAYNDDVADTDASGWNMQAGRIHLTVEGDSYPDVWKKIQERILKGCGDLGLKQLTTAEGLKQPALSYQALTPAVLHAQRAHGFMVLRAITPDGLHNFASRVRFLVFSLEKAEFTETGAKVTIECWPVPCGITGWVPFDHRDSRELWSYLKDWLESGELGEFRGSPIAKALKKP